jgi:hypothetical protein
MFFMLARSLKLAGMNYPEIEMMLRSEADYAYTPRQRRAMEHYAGIDVCELAPLSTGHPA